MSIAVDQVDADKFSSQRIVSLNTLSRKLKELPAEGGELADLSQRERILVQMMNVRHCIGIWNLEGLSFFIHSYSQHLTELQKA
jgi:hypothetical protein